MYPYQSTYNLPIYGVSLCYLFVFSILTSGQEIIWNAKDNQHWHIIFSPGQNVQLDLCMLSFCKYKLIKVLTFYNPKPIPVKILLLRSEFLFVFISVSPCTSRSYLLSSATFILISPIVAPCWNSTACTIQPGRN